MLSFLHTFHPTAIALTLGPISIHWYGITMVAGMLAGLQVARYLAKRVGIKAEQVYDLGFYLILFSLIGARVYAVLLNLPFYLANPWEIPALWHGGLAIHGAIIGGVLTLWIYSRRVTPSRSPLEKGENKAFIPPVPRRDKREVNWFWFWADIAAPALALGQVIGRWGNYFNQELFGRPTSLPWGIPIDLQFRPSGFEQFAYFHPTFLYESFLNLINFFMLFWLAGKWLFPLKVRGKTEGSYDQTITPPARHARQLAVVAGGPTPSYVKRGSGRLAAVYLINYGIIRILMEQLRTDEAPVFLGLRWPIIASIALIVCGGILVFRSAGRRV